MSEGQIFSEGLLPLMSYMLIKYICNFIFALLGTTKHFFMTSLQRSVTRSFPLCEDELKSSSGSFFELDAFLGNCITLTHGKWK